MSDSEILCEYDFEEYMNAQQKEEKLDMYEEFCAEMGMCMTAFSKKCQTVCTEHEDHFSERRNLENKDDKNQKIKSKNAQTSYEASKEFDSVIYAQFSGRSANIHSLDGNEGAA